MLEIMLSLLSIGKDAYDFVGDIRRGDPNKEVVAELKQLNQKVEKLSDHIWYAPGLQLVHDTSINRQHVLTDLREVRQSLEPVQRVMNDDILASAMILRVILCTEQHLSTDQKTLSHTMISTSRSCTEMR